MAGSVDMDEERAVVKVTLLATGALNEEADEREDEIILLLLLKAAVDAAPNDRAAKTAPGKNFIVILSCEKSSRVATSWWLAW